MDRSLDESIAERQRTSNPGRRPPPRRDNYGYPRDGIKKVGLGLDKMGSHAHTAKQSSRDSRTNLDNDWVHDRFDDEPKGMSQCLQLSQTLPNNNTAQHSASRNRSYQTDSYARESPEAEPIAIPAKLRVDNLHYDLTEDDLYDLFERIAPVSAVSLRYDRAGRSEGTAFVTYANVADARAAIREFDGANAKGQPIRLTLLPIGPAGGRARQTGRRDNPFDRVENPRTLFDRIEPPKARRGGRDRSASPDEYDSYDEIDSRRRGPRRGGVPPARDRRSDVTKPPPDNIDRYVPGQSNGRATSRRNEGRESGRRPGERRERGGGNDRGRGGRDRSERGENGTKLVNGRPRKTQEELDAEMEDYWGNANTAGNGGDAAAPAGHDGTQSAVAGTATVPDDDIDMIE